MLLTGCSGSHTTLPRERAALGLEGILLYDFNVIRMGEGLTAFCMPHYRSREDSRNLWEVALDKLRITPGWHVESIPAERVAQLMRTYCPESVLLPDSGGMFEAWFFAQGRNCPDTIPGERPMDEWTMGFFDADEGWWLYIADTGRETGGNAQMVQAGPVAIRAGCQPPDEGPWNMGEITREELVRLMNRTQEEVWPKLYPAEGIAFDRWRWEDRSGGKVFSWNENAFPQVLVNAGIQDSRDWVLTLYDDETGLLVVYEYRN